MLPLSILEASSFSPHIRALNAAEIPLFPKDVRPNDFSLVIPGDGVSALYHRCEAGGCPGFRNPWDSWRDQRVIDILWAMIMRRLTGKANTPDTTPPTVPVRKPEFLPLRSRSSSSIRATWLGHACYLIEFPSGLRVLFDPVFSHRCAPYQWLGPARYTPAPCEITDIPFVDAVCISHCHYDHMDHPTIMQILKRHPNVHFFLPLKNKEIFTKWGIPASQITELDWWEEQTLTLSTDNSISVDKSKKYPESSAPEASITATISCLPCQHMSARTPFDKARALWSSWSVSSGGKSVYFAGDTGYRSVPANLPDDVNDYGPEHNYPSCPAFAEIGAHRGPFDLGLIPIGAYAPRFVMSPMHANPMDAVNIFRDTRCRRALGMHWRTWVLTEEDVLEPPRKLKEALKSKDIAEEGVFDVCDIGESREFE